MVGVRGVEEASVESVGEDLGSIGSYLYSYKLINHLVY